MRSMAWSDRTDCCVSRNDSSCTYPKGKDVLTLTFRFRQGIQDSVCLVGKALTVFSDDIEGSAGWDLVEGESRAASIRW